MRLHIRSLRKIIRESISEAHKSKLWELFQSGPDGYNQAVQIWDSIDPGGCPVPEDSVEWFDDEGEGPWILKLFGETTMSLEDPAFFDNYCSAEWETPYDALMFNFNFSFVCGDDDADFDFGMGERFYVVPGTDRDEILSYIDQDITNQLGDLTDGTWWNNWVSLDVDVPGQAELTELENGWCNVTVKYN